MSVFDHSRALHSCMQHWQCAHAHFVTVALSSHFFLQEYKAHDRSREAIEMALDEILKQKMKIRHKYGFKPPKSGRRTDVQGDPTVSCILVLCTLC